MTTTSSSKSRTRRKRRKLVLDDETGNLFLEVDGSTTRKPFRLIGGSIHYFRIHPAYWEDRILKCKQMGCNTVETYVAWNVHQPTEGEDGEDAWNFVGFANLTRFVELCDRHSMYMVVRVSPYICAEWDNGGIPYWLLKDRNIRLRSRHPKFWKACKRYYNVIIDKLRPYFSTSKTGGPIIAGQLENEYGCTNNDTEYLQQHYNYLTTELKVDIPLFNGIWTEERFYNAGYCQGNTIVVALNFNDQAKSRFDWLQKTVVSKENNYNTPRRPASKKYPNICTEFWVGWFTAWGGHRYKAKESPQVIAKRLDELLCANNSHVILYVFTGGTNFGLQNGSNIRADYCLFTITSYDYEAPLSESGQITPYYTAIQQVLQKHTNNNNNTQQEESPTTTKHEAQEEEEEAESEEEEATTTTDPSLLPTTSIIDPLPPIAYPSIRVTHQAILFDQISTTTATKITTTAFQKSNINRIDCPYPLTMEECDQDYGYLLYRTKITGPTPPPPPPSTDDNHGEYGDQITINELRDRAHIYINQQYLETLERTTGRSLVQTCRSWQTPAEGCWLDILVENQGRCNFPPFSHFDSKGITENVWIGDCFILSNWQHYPITFSQQQLQQELIWSTIVPIQQQEQHKRESNTTTPGSNGRGHQDDDPSIHSSNVPGFFRANFNLPTTAAGTTSGSGSNDSTPVPRDTYIYLPQWQKGVVIVNGFIIGRYWNAKGPQRSLYCPGPILRLEGKNEIIIFEEEKAGQIIEFHDRLIMMESETTSASAGDS